MPDPPTPRWTEAGSAAFPSLAGVAAPGRREQMNVLVSLIPAAEDDAFLAAGIAVHGGYR